jgi:hypothetical protein
MPTLNAFLVPTGGAVRLELTTAVSGAISLGRAVSGVSGLGPFTTLYSGVPLRNDGLTAFYVDVGDFAPAPLDPTLQYVYQLQDVNGVALTPPTQPVAGVNIEQDELTWIMFRLLKAGLSNLSLPAGIQPIKDVVQAMPLGDLPPTPIVVANPEMIQQADQQIGADTEVVASDNTFTRSELARRVFRVSVISQNAVERDFYRDAIIAIFKVALTYVLQPLGNDVRHSWQAESYQVSDEQKSFVPGFYGCDLLLEITGIYNIAITTTYGLIQTITTTASGSLDPTLPPVTITVSVSGVRASG